MSDIAGIHYDTNMAQPDNYQIKYDSKTKIVGLFYSLPNAFIKFCSFLEVRLEKI